MGQLSDYESQVVRDIAAWKGRVPGAYSRVTNGLTRPFARVLSRIVPQRAAIAAITTAYVTADWLASPDWVLKKAHVACLAELQARPLEFCDRLADRVGFGSQTIALVDGVVTGAGGFVLAAADVGALTIVALRAICRVGQCYGYALDRPQDRPYVLGIMMVAGIKNPAERLDMLGKLEEVRQWALGETIEAVAVEAVAAQLVRLASLEAVPGLGALFGSAANVVFVRQVLRAARHIFQERRLRDSGKVPPVVPAS